MSDDIVKATTALPAVGGSVRLNGFEEVIRLADYLSRARGFVPDSLAGNAPGIAMAILTGLEIGIGPAEAVRSIHIVKGRPMLDASLMTKLAIRGGVTVDYPVSTDTECTVLLRRAGREHRESFTMQDAQRAGLWGQGSWKSYPKRLLQCRALSMAVRAWAPDVIGSAVYVEGELDAAEPAREVEATVVREPEPQAQRPAKPAKDPALARILREELPQCSHADELISWAAEHHDRLSALTNGARDAARSLVIERARTLPDVERDEAASDALTAEVLRVAGLAEAQS